MTAPSAHLIVTARDEAARLPATLAALSRAFPDARVVVADDGSRDATAAVARAAGAEVVSTGRRVGKGGAATLAAQRALALGAPGEAIVLLCDADLGASAERLAALAVRVQEEERPTLAVAAFARREGGGFGVAVGFARWALRRRTGLELRAPISGQRALRAGDLARLLPFAPRFAMEMGMTVDAARMGVRVVEVDVDLEHRATGRSIAGFWHRARQLGDFLLLYARRR